MRGIPTESSIATLMKETGMQRMQAINHLRCRPIAQAAARERDRSGARWK